MPYKNKASRTAKDAKKKPKLQWRVVKVFPTTEQNVGDALQSALQELTDAKWRVFDIVAYGAELWVSAYLSSWNAEPEGDEA